MALAVGVWLAGQRGYNGTMKAGTKHRATQTRQWTLYYDGDCGICTLLVRWLSRLDFFRRTRWTAYQTLEHPPAGLTWTDLSRSAYLESDGGRLYEGFYAFRMLALRLVPLLPLAPVLWMPGLHLLGVAIYRWVARNRYRLSASCALPSAAHRHEAGPASDAQGRA